MSAHGLNDGESLIGDTDQLSEAERQLLLEDLEKAEQEIATLKQVLDARQKQAAVLKRQLGLTPLAELGKELNKTLQGVTESESFKKTSEVAAATADTVKDKWTAMRNTSFFKSFEGAVGGAVNTAKLAASTSIDKLSNVAKPNQNSQN